MSDGRHPNRARTAFTQISSKPGKSALPLFDSSLIASRSANPSSAIAADMAECLVFVAEGKVKADVELQPLLAINSASDRPQHAKSRRASCSISAFADTSTCSTPNFAYSPVGGISRPRTFAYLTGPDHAKN